VTAVNRNLALSKYFIIIFCLELNIAVKQDSRKKNTTPRELLRFYGIQMAMENTYGRSPRVHAHHGLGGTTDFHRAAQRESARHIFPPPHLS